MSTHLTAEIFLGQAAASAEGITGISPVYFIIAIIVVLSGVGVVRWHQSRHIKKMRQKGLAFTGRVRERDRPMRPLH